MSVGVEITVICDRCGKELDANVSSRNSSPDLMIGVNWCDCASDNVEALELDLDEVRVELAEAYAQLDSARDFINGYFDI